MTLAKPRSMTSPLLVNSSLAKAFGIDQHHMVANLVRDKLIYYGRATCRQNHMQA